MEEEEGAGEEGEEGAELHNLLLVLKVNTDV